MKILVADGDAAHREHLQPHLRRMGHEVREAADAAAALEAVRDAEPALVLADLALGGPTGVELTERIRQERPETFVVVMTRPGVERAAMNALRAGAANYLGKPADPAELNNILQKCGDLLAVRDEERMVPAMVRFMRIVLEVPNDLRFAARVSDYLLRDIPACHRDADITGLTLGLQEMLQNAIEHGNLGITYDEKTRHLEAGDFAEVVDRRRADPRYADRRVEVEMQRDPEGFWCRIRDRGDGFDWRCLPDPLTADGLLEMHGRGIYLTRFSYDSVEFNEAGNEVVLRKRFHPA